MPFERSINKAQAKSPLAKAFFSSFLAFSQYNVNFHVTFKSHFFNQNVSHSYKTLFVHVRFSQRLLIHLVRDIWASSFLFSTSLTFFKLFQVAFLHLKNYSHEEND